jgi:hypothetical protein
MGQARFVHHNASLGQALLQLGAQRLRDFTDVAAKRDAETTRSWLVVAWLVFTSKTSFLWESGDYIDMISQ